MFVFCLPATAQEENNSLTHGAVQMTLKVGETQQLEIIEKFGAPNITTIDGSGQEVWVYRRHATITSSKSKSGGFSIGILAGGNNVGGGAGFSKKKSSSNNSQSARAMTLVIKFDANKIVSDFRSRSSSF